MSKRIDAIADALKYLETARSEIEKSGRVAVGRYYDSNKKCHCSVGAVVQASTEEPAGSYNYINEMHMNPGVRIAIGYLADVAYQHLFLKECFVGAVATSVDIFTYNDKHAGNISKILDMFDGAIAAAQQALNDQATNA